MKTTSVTTWSDLKSAVIKATTRMEQLFGWADDEPVEPEPAGVAEKQGRSSLRKKTIKIAPALALLLLGTQPVFAQKSAVLNAFSKYGIDAGMLDPANLQQPDDYAYELKQTTITTGKESALVARFDPTAAKEEQWTVVSVNGQSPSRSDINGFRKSQNKADGANRTDDASYRIENESADKLVISYKVDAASVPKDAAFMKDCRSYMTINLGNKQLEQVRVINEKPLKIKILNADKFELVQLYLRNDASKRYFPLHQSLDIQSKFMGQDVRVQTTTEYANYSKK